MVTAHPSIIPPRRPLQPITLTGTNQFDNNWYDGLDVYSKEIIAFTSITANGNGLAHDGGNTIGGGVFVVNDYNTASPQAVQRFGYQPVQ